MSTVIFLGAGASAAEGAPLQSELFRAYFEAVKIQGAAPARHEMEESLATFFHLMFGIDVHHADLSRIEFPTFEEVLGILDLAIQRGEAFRNYESHNIASNSGQLQRVRVYLVLSMAKAIDARLRGASPMHGQLVKNLAQHGLLKEMTFVSTNYDILIDNALAEHFRADPGAHIDYGIDLANFERSDSGWARPGTDSVRLLKIHGSLNWLYCPTCNTVTLFRGEKRAVTLVDDIAAATCPQCETLMDPIIVPPTFFKNLSSVFLSAVWHRAEMALRRADRIVFCGYSFPDADIHIKYLMKRVQTNREGGRTPQFIVANRTRNKEEERRYARFLGQKLEYRGKDFAYLAEHPEEFCG